MKTFKQFAEPEFSEPTQQATKQELHKELTKRGLKPQTQGSTQVYVHPVRRLVHVHVGQGANGKAWWKHEIHASNDLKGLQDHLTSIGI